MSRRTASKTLTLTFTVAASAKQLGTLHVTLPWSFDADMVYDEIGECLLGLTVLDAMSMPLYQYLDLHDASRLLWKKLNAFGMCFWNDVYPDRHANLAGRHECTVLLNNVLETLK